MINVKKNAYYIREILNFYGQRYQKYNQEDACIDEVR